MAESSWAGIQYSDLSDEQKEFLLQIIRNNSRNYFLHGCAGSGKTVVAAHAARILTDEDKTVKFVVYTKLLSKFVADGFKGVNASIQEVEHYHGWIREFVFDGYYDMTIVDECQDFQSNWVDNVKTHSNNQIWLGDASQQIYADAMKDTGFSDIHSEFNEQEFQLKINYRNSISIAQLAKCFITLNEFDNKTIEEKISDFILPIQNNDLQTAEANNQPNLFIEAADEAEEYDAIAKIIKDIQGNAELKKQIAIAQLHHKHLDIIQDELESRGVELNRITHAKSILPDFSDRNLTILTPIHSLKGLEVDYVIFPRTEDYNIEFWEDEQINDNLMFVLFSRAKSRVFCSYTDKDSSYVYNGITNDINNDFFQFVSAAEVLNKGTPIESNKQIAKKIDSAEEKLKGYFDDLDIE
jgi:superfamily I DNA/RNA helicase|tara:strand:- start:2523 stop:3755 length:1233 start_codon:yes stop_codon:yes gene_type:complete